MQVASQQNAVSQKLHMLETHQKETHDSLVQMERTAISMYQVSCLSGVRFPCLCTMQMLKLAVVRVVTCAYIGYVILLSPSSTVLALCMYNPLTHLSTCHHRR